MSKVYEKRFTVADGNALEIVESHAPTGFRIDLPPAGMVKKLLIKQVSAAEGGGSPTGAKVNLYNSHVVATEGHGTSSSTSVNQMDKDLAQVIPEQAVVSGTKFELFVATEGYAYMNMDGTPTVPDRALYLEINPLAEGTTLWEVAIAVVPSLAG